jgi:hypothetical protein
VLGWRCQGPAGHGRPGRMARLWAAAAQGGRETLEAVPGDTQRRAGAGMAGVSQATGVGRVTGVEPGGGGWGDRVTARGGAGPGRQWGWRRQRQLRQLGAAWIAAGV